MCMRLRVPVYRETCAVADQFCTDAANFEGAWARAECFCCGLAVCTKCSSKRRYQGVKRRVCNDCQVSYLDDGSEARVMARMRRLAGVA